MILSNEQMESRAREGLKRWFCRLNHRHDHSVRPVRDDEWGVIDYHFSCSKCSSKWTVARPISAVVSRSLAKACVQAIWEQLWDRDPVYELLLEKK
jgi:hypothetical protein